MDLTFVKGNLPPEVPPAITRSDCDRAVALHGWRFALCFEHVFENWGKYVVTIEL
jgi:hypothetical protein